MAGERVVLAVTGSIAAFKAATLASELASAGLDVRVILTPGGSRFVTPLTFEALTGHSAIEEVWDEQPGSSRMGHLELARWADILVVAPASADAIAKLALGLAGDLLGATALACRAPLLIAPAMETAMFEHPAVQEHLTVLRRRGTTVLGPETGRLASGAEGRGRMSEPATILAAIRARLDRRGELAGLRVLVTAGPTIEALDRVRYIGNRSSGKMGYAIAAEAQRRGAKVILVSGPTSLDPPRGVNLERVESAAQMMDAVLRQVEGMDVVVMAAAVADFTPAAAFEGKIKRKDALHLDLVPTADIAAAASAAAPHALHVGFALETADLIAASREKMARKGQSLVVANAISPEHNPFGAEHNTVTIVSPEDAIQLPSLPKEEVAARVWDEIAGRLRRSV